MRTRIRSPWRRLTLAGVLVAGALALSGCFVLSVHPLYTDDVITFDEGLIGVWGDAAQPGAETWQFQDNGDGAYLLIIRDEDTTDVRPQDGQFTAHVVRLGDDVYLDLFPEEPETGNEFFLSHVVPGHSLWRLQREGDTLILSALSQDAIIDLIEQHGLNIAHVVRDDVLVLTADTDALQQLFRAHRDALFPESESMPRIR